MKRLILAAVAALFLPAVAHAQHVYQPTYGSPNSTQFRSISIAMDVSSVQFEGADRFTVDGDTDVIGGALTHWWEPGLAGNRYELRYQKAWRPFEGQRTRALIDTPLNIITFKGDTATTATISGGLEFPVNENWSLTPRLAYGAAWVPTTLGADGGAAVVSVASRYRFPQVGRGDLVWGSMLGYTTTVNGILTTKDPFYAATKNTIYRSGLAYQWPMQTMMFGRQTSARVSYTYTHTTGDLTPQDNFNELAVNFGVRNREDTAKNRFDLLRFGLMYNFGQNINGVIVREVTATVGYRF